MHFCLARFRTRQRAGPILPKKNNISFSAPFASEPPDVSPSRPLEAHTHALTHTCQRVPPQKSQSSHVFLCFLQQKVALLSSPPPKQN
mmetsp:Transcript_7885/g.17140  ORF Transcript_7885/g.17140 Transcript_7885/m.17140 type:complete len:88 (-) Transcript_7885:72-335(-)